MSIGSVSHAGVSQQVQVQLAKGSGEQLEAVMLKLLEGLDAAARAPEQTGHTLNIAA